MNVEFVYLLVSGRAYSGRREVDLFWGLWVLPLLVVCCGPVVTVYLRYRA